MSAPLNPSGGQAWFVLASPAERWALTKLYLNPALKVPGDKARRHRRLRDALRIGRVIDALKAGGNKVKTALALDDDTKAVYTITAENLEWLTEVIALVSSEGEDAVRLDALLERCEEAKAGAEVPDAPAWSAEADDWAPPAESAKAEAGEGACPSCGQLVHPSELKPVEAPAAAS